MDVTGGKLEIPKCKYSIMTWKYDEDGIAHINPEPQLPPIKLIDSSTNNDEYVPGILPSMAYKLLGVMIPLDGNNNQQYKYL